MRTATFRMRTNGMDVSLPTLPSQSRIRSTLRIAGLVAFAVVMFLPVLLLWLLTLEQLRAYVVRFFYQTCRQIAGIRVTVEGEISPQRPLMLVANHTSYLDIFVLGSLVPLSFTPKLEIRSWPIIGFFCVLADCVFIERRPADMQRAQAVMGEKLKARKVLVLFPEGTTGDGWTIKPFKSGFLSLVEEHDLPLQPVSLAYTHIGDIPITATTREQVAWVGEASFVSHFVRLLRFPSVRVQVRCYAAQKIADHEDRKALAKSCETIIRVGLHTQLEAAGVIS